MPRLNFPHTANAEDNVRVAINGIGVAGPTLAYWLRAFGHEPVLFERASEFRTGGYLIDFWGLGYDVAERMGVLANLREHGYSMERIRFIGEHGRETASLDVRPMREALNGRFTSIARSDLSAALLGACAGIPAHYGVSISGIEDAGSAAAVALSDGRTEQFDLVVGSDGLHSHVRATVFRPEQQFETFLGCYVAAFRVSGYPRRDELTYVMHTVPKRQVARVSLRNNETLILLVCRSEYIDGNLSAGEQKGALRRAFGDMGWEVPEILDRMDDTTEIYFDRVSQIHLPHWSAGRVALVGDAAACPSLLAGEGSGLAMTEAYVLAGELHRADGDYARAFAAYEARLHSFVAAKQKAALGFRGFFAPESAFSLKIRNAAVHALALPYMTKVLAARSFRDDLKLPHYLAA
jgi:2-polyprenyl-6-methoxyphenol hydroxylase-like FAD-dependent oxidoreductase